MKNKINSVFQVTIDFYRLKDNLPTFYQTRRPDGAIRIYRTYKNHPNTFLKSNTIHLIIILLNIFKVSFYEYVY